jgi:hypothetical protein
MRKADVKRLAASYGLYIDEKTWVRQACNGKLYKAMEVYLLDWKLAWGADGHWDLVPAPHLTTGLGLFGPDGPGLPDPNIVDQFEDPEGSFEVVGYKVANFVRNHTYNLSTIKIWNLDELKQFFDDFYAKWAERRKLHKIKEISSVSDNYTV